MKLISKANDHIQNTAQGIANENNQIIASFALLREDVVFHEFRASRTHERHVHEEIMGVHQIRVSIENEREERTSEDYRLLDTIMNTQKHLQQTVSVSRRHEMDAIRNLLL